MGININAFYSIFGQGRISQQDLKAKQNEVIKKRLQQIDEQTNQNNVNQNLFNIDFSQTNSNQPLNLNLLRQTATTTTNEDGEEEQTLNYIDNLGRIQQSNIYKNNALEMIKKDFKYNKKGQVISYNIYDSNDNLIKTVTNMTYENDNLIGWSETNAQDEMFSYFIDENNQMISVNNDAYQNYILAKNNYTTAQKTLEQAKYTSGISFNSQTTIQNMERRLEMAKNRYEEAQIRLRGDIA